MTTRSDTDWFRDARWGVFTHYLGQPTMSAVEWNRQVDAFDVRGLADQLESVGAGYYFMTIGQNSGHYCAPNTTYDKLTGIRPSKCSERDLIADLHDALRPKGIKLLVYLASGAPDKDPVAVKKLEWEFGAWEPRSSKRLGEFQVKWEAIIREWSVRWGGKIGGWWIDGCYFADDMYRHPEPPNFQSFAAAMKAGNPASIVAFNPEVLTPVVSTTEWEDYTAGEIANAFPTCPGRWIDGAQFHVLSYLGEVWGGGVPRFPDSFVVGYTRHVNAHEGVVTWDVPITSGGQIPPSFLEQLAAVGKATR